MISELSGYQKELLAHIEFIGRFYGVVSRADLVKRFDISEASATRTFQLYNSLAPYNLIYKPNIRRYEWQDAAKPIIDVAMSKCVSTLTDGFGDSFARIDEEPIAIKNSLFNVNLEVLSAVTRAIKRKQVIKIDYFSKSSPKGSARDIIPHAIADSGLRWHVRAFDRKSMEFRDFVINRIKKARPLSGEVIPETQTGSSDSDWNEVVELKIQAHPNLSGSKSMIEFEYRMVNGLLRKKVRKALAGYLLDTWNIDTSEDACLKGNHVMLHLKNSNELSFPGKLLAPGSLHNNNN